MVLHEPRASALRRAARRLERAAAGRDVAPVTTASSEAELRRWAGKVDWVLADAPCSNSGSLRRHPECKYRLFECEEGAHELLALVRLQRSILRQARDLLREGGTLVYSTCSLLHEENEEQLHWAEAELGMQSLPAAFSGCFPPVEGGRDGFFAAVLRKVA
mmetsp:Transcript_106198/g.342592  ORF Transcript_106198/g.342592 Transcript_106198/m.342592 type:complete len:161 (-) Transcript_106198:757-1239(-)